MPRDKDGVAVNVFSQILDVEEILDENIEFINREFEWYEIESIKKFRADCNLMLVFFANFTKRCVQEEKNEERRKKRRGAK